MMDGLLVELIDGAFGSFLEEERPKQAILNTNTAASPSNMRVVLIIVLICPNVRNG